MSWTDWIKDFGIGRVAHHLGLSYAGVHKWIAGNGIPSGTNLKSLVSLARSELTPEDFDAFMSSLSSDLFGVERNQ